MRKARKSTTELNYTDKLERQIKNQDKIEKFNSYLKKKMWETEGICLEVIRKMSADCKPCRNHQSDRY